MMYLASCIVIHLQDLQDIRVGKTHIQLQIFLLESRN